MYDWLGMFLIIYGAAQLALNENAVRWKRRFKPWWRDDENRDSDRRLANRLRITTFVGSVFSIELGIYLAGVDRVSLPWRVLLYVVFAGVFWMRAGRRDNSPF